MPADTNANCDAFDGRLIAQMDLGGAVLARHCAVPLKPAKAGDVVSIYLTMRREYRTSMKSAVGAWASRQPEGDRLGQPMQCSPMSRSTEEGDRGSSNMGLRSD